MTIVFSAREGEVILIQMNTCRLKCGIGPRCHFAKTNTVKLTFYRSMILPSFNLYTGKLVERKTARYTPVIIMLVHKVKQTTKNEMTWFLKILQYVIRSRIWRMEGSYLTYNRNNYDPIPCSSQRVILD